MAVWLVRAGRNGEQEDSALEHSVVTIGWNELPDLSDINNREELRELFNEIYPDTKKMAAANKVGQIWALVLEEEE